MSRIRMSDEQWLEAIKECRSSGLSDKEWCSSKGIHTATFYRVIKRLRNKACNIPVHDQRVVSLPQEVVEIASIDENGVITQAGRGDPDLNPGKENTLVSYEQDFSEASFGSTVRIATPSGITIELTNRTDAATIRTILGVLQSV